MHADADRTSGRDPSWGVLLARILAPILRYIWRRDVDMT